MHIFFCLYYIMSLWHVLLPQAMVSANCNQILRPPMQSHHATHNTVPRSAIPWGGPTLSPCSCVWALSLSGLNLPNLHNEQLVSHVTTLSKCSSQHCDPTGVLLHTSCKLLHLEARMSAGNLFQISLHICPCLTKTWVSSSNVV